jgi:hypothetical protein
VHWNFFEGEGITTVQYTDEHPKFSGNTNKLERVIGCDVAITINNSMEKI